MWYMLLFTGTFAISVISEQVIPLKSTPRLELQNEIISYESRAHPASKAKQVITEYPSRIARNAIVDANRLWPDGRIPFVFDANVPAFSKVEILAAMQEIESSVYAANTACVIFIPRQSEVDYLHISWTSMDHASTVIGRQGGRQELKINTKGGRGHDDNLNVLMIVLGLYPEVMRTDRDSYLNIDFSNSVSSQAFQKLSGVNTDFFGQSFDYNSLLMYTPYQYASNPSKPVMTAIQSNHVLGQSVSLSTGDVTLLQHTYHCTVDTSNRVDILTNTQINCHFHSDFCNLQQDQTDQFDWTLSSNSNAGSGPSADYSSGSGQFAVASALNHHNLVARLKSTTFAPGEYCLRLSLYMFGSDLGRLDVKVTHAGGEVSLYSHQGSLTDEWYHIYAGINSKANFQIVFQATIGNGDRSDIALDDIYIYNGLCIEWS